MYTSTALSLLTVSIVFPILAALFTSLRFLARKIQKGKPSIDDWVIVLCLVFCFGQAVETIVGVSSNALGVPLESLTEVQAVIVEKIVYADAFLCFSAESTVKVAVLLFYRRIFITRKFRMVTDITMVATILWWLSSILLLLCDEFPISSNWSLGPTKSNFDFHAFLLSTSIIDLILDVWILLIPLQVIKNLHIATRRKFILVGIFWLGFFCSIAEAVRIYYFHTFLYVPDSAATAFSSNVANILIWSRVEPCCSIVAASLPTLSPLIQNGRSPESLISSIRSVFSSRNNSPNGEKSHELSPRNDTGAGGVTQWKQQHNLGFSVDSSGPLDNESSEALSPPGDNQIVVQKTFASRYDV